MSLHSGALQPSLYATIISALMPLILAPWGWKMKYYCQFRLKLLDV